jgi:uncharacterized protein YodC (DUF2158 family)
MKKAFKIGESVRLKSGGPTMTVTHIASAGTEVTCKWFARKKLEEGKFPALALEYPPQKAITKKEKEAP